MKQHQPSKARKARALLLVAFLATMAVAVLAPSASAATCSASDGAKHVESQGNQSCNVDCNPLGCNAQARDYQAP